MVHKPLRTQPLRREDGQGEKLQPATHAAAARRTVALGRQRRQVFHWNKEQRTVHFHPEDKRDDEGRRRRQHRNVALQRAARTHHGQLRRHRGFPHRRQDGAGNRQLRHARRQEPPPADQCRVLFHARQEWCQLVRLQPLRHGLYLPQRQPVQDLRY